MTMMILLALELWKNEAFGVELERPDGWIAYEEKTRDALLKFTFVKGNSALVLWVADAKGTAAQYRDAAATSAEGKRGSGAIGGETSEFVGPYHYVARKGFIYLFHAIGEDAEAILKSVRFSEPKTEWRLLAVKCETTLPWAGSWEEAAARAKKERREIFLVVEQFKGFPFPEVAVTSLGVDPDIVEIVKSKYVPLRLASGNDGPFDLAVYGMGTGTWGRAVLICNADGKVLREICTIEPQVVLKFLGGTLNRKKSEPETQFWLGARKYFTDRTGAQAVWEELLKKHPESPWAWKAAANLLGTGAFVNGNERLTRPPAELVAAFAQQPRGEGDAAAYLVKTQREDGTWPAPLEILYPSPHLVVAATALCGRSLIGHDAKAVERALRYVRAHDIGPSGDGEFDYTIWAQICVLDFYAACGLPKDCEEIARSMADRQERNGGWSYSSAVSGTSFVTAAAILALRAARDAGSKIDPEMIRRAEACVKSMRGKDGLYAYCVGTPATVEGALRTPLCEYAIGGDLDSAFAIYLKHRRAFSKESGKSLLHTGPEGQGCHYLGFDYAMAALAVGKREEVRKALREDVLAAQRGDGSILHSPMMGAPVGTALGLLALDRLR